MGDVGSKFAMSGYDALTAGDREHAMHSRFHSLPILKQGAFSGVAAGGTIVTHGAVDANGNPFVPLFIVFATIGGQTVMLPMVSEDASTAYRSPRINNTNLTNGASMALSGYYYIFNVPINVAIAAETVILAATTPDTANPDVGGRIAQDTKSAVTGAINEQVAITGRESAASSLSRQYLVHELATGTFAGPGVIINHGLNYVPTIWPYIKVADISGGDGRWEMLNNAFGDVTAFATATQVILGMGYDGDYSAVIFKDQSF